MKLSSKETFKLFKITHLSPKLFAILVSIISIASVSAQPTILFKGPIPTNPVATNDRFVLEDLGAFRRYRFEATQTNSSTWAFHIGTVGSPDYSLNWRPFTAGNLMSMNTFIPTSFANGARYNTTGGGADGGFNATSGRFYTWNVSENAASSNVMAVLETTFNPKTLTLTSQSPLAGNVAPQNTVTVTVTASSAPAVGENVFLRYTTNGFTDSIIVNVTFVGAVGTAVIPAQAVGTVVQYYFYSSNFTKTAVDALVGAPGSHGQVAHDMSTLNLSAGGTYTVNLIIVTSTLGIGALGRSYLTLSVAFAAINAGTHQGVITTSVWSDTTEPAGGASLNASGSGSASYTAISIQPAGGAARTIAGTTTSGVPLINFNGADGVTINGLNTGGNSLTISNTTVNAGPGTSTICFIGDATLNTIQNCTIRGASLDTAGGVIFFSSGTTGNNNNTISSNNITNVTNANRPRNVIYSAGSSLSAANSGNSIFNNNIYDFLNLANTSNGIQLAANNAAWTISGNSFYETASVAPTANTTYIIINCSDGSSVGITISGNFIGGQAASCGGSAWTKTLGANNNNNFIGINLNLGTSAASSIQNNTIRSFSWTNFGASTCTGIAAVSGLLNIGTVTGNTIGAATGTGSITISSGQTLDFFGINISSINTVNCNNNTIGSITTTGTTFPTNFIGVLKSNVAGVTTINNNIIGSTTTPSSINAGASPTTAQLVFGIRSLSTADITISGNTIANMASAALEASTSRINGVSINTSFGGIAVNTITDNKIFNLAIANSSTGTGVNASVAGIAIDDVLQTKREVITGNEIYNLSNENTSFAGTISGIYYTCRPGQASVVARNFIHDLYVTGGSSTTATINGINIGNSGNDTTYSNNIISLSGNSRTTLYGIYDIANYAGKNYFYYNTISISGSLSTGTNPSYCLRIETYTGGADTNIRNNIFSNTRSTVGGTNLHYGLYLNTFQTLAAAFVIGNNNYYTSGIGGATGYWSGATKTAAPIVTGEQDSSTTDPLFDKPNLTPASAALAADYRVAGPDLLAVTGTGITIDYTNITPRSLTVPTMGAFDVLMPYIGLSTTTLATFHYEPGQGASHELIFKVLGRNLIGGNITITPPANYEISTLSGGAFVAISPLVLAAVGGLVPSTIIYVRLRGGLSAGTYTSENIVCTATAATIRNVACSGRVGIFPVITTSVLELNNFGYAGGGNSNVQSYTVSGANLTANITITAPTEYEISLTAGSAYAASLILTQSGGIVNTTTIFARLKAAQPAGSYDNKLISNSSTGAYTEFIICNGLVSNAVQVWRNNVFVISYSTLKAAFDAVNAGTHKGVLQLRIAASTTESASAVLNASGGSSNYTSITIYPTATSLSIENSGNFNDLIDLNGADNVTIDGRVNATGGVLDLTINNKYNIALSTVRFINDATSNNIKFCNLRGGSNQAASGIINFSSTANTTGNDNNIIENNNFTNATNIERPYNSVYSVGTSALDNNNNTIRNNNFFNYFRINTAGRGIYVGANSTEFNITGNSFYETTTTGPGGGFTYASIEIDNTAGNNFIISDNFIGGNAPLATGIWTKATNSTTEIFIGILINAGITTATSVQNNVIRNFSHPNQSGGSWTGISATGGAVNIGTVTGNVIGAATGNNSIFYSSTNTTLLTGIEISSTGTINCEKNIIGSIVATNSLNSGITDIYGIRKTASAGLTNISNNQIGSVGTANSIEAASTSTNGGQVVYGIYSEGIGAITINGNTVANLTNRNTSIFDNGLINGIRVTAGSANTITNNIVGDLRIANRSTTGALASVSGINLNNTAAVKTVSGNTIYNLFNTNSDYAGDINGLYVQGNTGANVIAKNFIRNLGVTGASSTAASIYGINIASGAGTYVNNVISLGGNTRTTIYGIYENGVASQTCNLYFNTIFISGNVSSGTNKSYCVFSAAAANTRDFRNNIFRNIRSTASGASLHYNVSQTANTGLTSDYNTYTVTGTGGATGSLTSNRVLLSDWRTATGQDVNSTSLNPNIVDEEGTNAVDFKIYRRNLAGITGTGVTDDYEGTIRGITPSVGAFQNFETANVELFVNASAQFGYLTLKRAFDDINRGAFTGSVANPLQLRINKNTSEPTTAVLNASGTNGSLYNAITIYPTLTGLSITGNINGPLIDLNSADFVNFNGALNNTGTTKDLSLINTSTLNAATTSTLRFIGDASGNLVRNLNINGSSTSATAGTVFFSTGVTTGNDSNTIDACVLAAAGSNFPNNGIYSLGTASFNNNSNIISNNSIQDYFNPATDSSGISVLSNNDTWSITGNRLFQSSTKTLTANSAIIHGIRVVTTAGGHTINGNIIGYANANNTGTSTYGGAFTSSFRGIFVTATGAACTIQTNTIANISTQSKIDGIFLRSVGSSTTFNTNGNIITNLSSTATAGDVTGIYTDGSTSAIDIFSNTINNLSSAGMNAIVSGATIASGLAVNLYSNTISAITGTGTTAPIANGIAIGGSTGTAVNVYKNKIYDIDQNATNSGAIVNGVNITGGTSVTIFNNLIGDLKAPLTSNNFAINGILVDAGAASTASNIYFNTIYIAATSTNTNFGTAGIRHTSNATATTNTLNLRNNLIYNNSTPNGTGKTHVLYRSSSSLSNYAATSNNNLFYAGIASTNNLIYSDGTNNEQTLTDFQTRVTGRESLSKTGIVTFLSFDGVNGNFLVPNFTVDATSSILNGQAAAIATFTDDIIGSVRQTNPDIGAYESICNVTQLAVSPNGIVVICDGPQLLTASILEPNAVYSWKRNGVAVGTNSSTFSATTSGNYTVEYAFCGAPSISAATAITINVTAAPTASNQAVCAGSTISTLSASGAALKWYLTPTGGIALASLAVVAPNTYYVSQTVSTCESVRTAIIVTLNPVPTVNIQANAVICANKITPITAIGTADTYTWTSTVSNSLFTDAGATVAYIPGTNASTIYLRTASTATITAIGTITATTCATSVATEQTLSVAITTYNGAYNNGLPDGTKGVIFSSGNINLSSNLNACSCTINGGTVTVNSGVNFNVVNAISIISGSLIFENGSSLTQETNVANIGNIIYKRNTAAMNNNFDFTYWGSPVANQTLGGIWMSVNSNDTFYSWTSSTNTWTPRSAANTMASAIGYIARARTGTNGIDFNAVTTGYTSGTPWQARFFGVPNNGNYTVAVSGAGGFNDNLLANPYPSALDIVAFKLDLDNTSRLTGNFYFWTHTTAIASNTYNASDYAIFNVALNASVTTSGTPTPDRFVDAGQGFFAEGLANGNITFKNSHRVAGNNNAFYRVSPNQSINGLAESHKIWLNLTNSQGLFKQQLLSYSSDATMGFDPTMDARTLDGNNYIDFYSTADNEKLTIQSRAVPFVDSDLVPIGFKTSVAGSYSISIDHKDGLFNSQTVYLQDNLLNIDHNLSLAPYNFATATGMFNNRFVLKYTSTILGIDNPNTITNYVNVYKNNETIVINSSRERIEKVLIFDLLGRKVFEQTNLDTNEFVAKNITLNEQVVIVKVQLKSGSVSSTKVVY